MDENKNTNDIMDHVQDAVPDSIHPFLDYLLKNGKMIAGIIGAIIVLAAGYSYMQYSKQSAMQQAEAKMGAIMIQYSGTEQAQRLEAFQPEAPEEMQSAIELALAKAYMDASEFEKAANAWKKIADKGGAISSVATLGQAKSLILGDKPTEAVSLLQKLKAKVGENYKATINRLLASAAVMSGKYQLAIQAYQALMSNNPSERMYYENRVAELKAKL